MPENINIEKERIVEFVEEKFPGHKLDVGNGYWFIHASKKLGWTIHYEYNHGYCQKHSQRMLINIGFHPFS